MYLASALHKLEAANQRLPLEASPSTAHRLYRQPAQRRGRDAAVLSTHPPTEEKSAASSVAASGNF